MRQRPAGKSTDSLPHVRTESKYVLQFGAAITWSFLQVLHPRIPSSGCSSKSSRLLVRLSSQEPRKLMSVYSSGRSHSPVYH